MNVVDSSLKSVIEDHRRRLVDLTFRNRLLNARPGPWLLECVAPDATVVEDHLAKGRQVKLSGTSRGATSLELAIGEEKADAACLKLYRRTVSRMEETGLQVLYLGLGVVKYSEPQSVLNEERRIPLVMLPVTMSRMTTKSGFSIKATSDAAAFNTTFTEWVRQQHGVIMPEWPDGLPLDDAGVDLNGVLDEVRQSLIEHPAFEVTPDIVLGHFDYQKLAMHRDLERLAEMDDHSAALTLVTGTEGGNASPMDALPLIGRDELDSRFEPKDLALLLPADAHQAAAVGSAAVGCSFVLMGPPGTGKSQTIANIIADSISKGKTVLFCAEKATALEAVTKRLKSVGLDRFCLDLHSCARGELRPAADIAKELNADISGQTFIEAQADKIAYRLQVSTRKLNAYAEAVKKTKHGRTFVDAVGLAQGPYFNAAFKDVDDDGEYLEELKDALVDGVKMTIATGEMEESWHPLRKDSGDNDFISALRDAADGVGKAAEGAEDAESNLETAWDVRRAAEFSYSETPWYQLPSKWRAHKRAVECRRGTDEKMNALRLSNERHRRALDHFRTVGNVSRAGCEEFARIVVTASDLAIQRWMKRNAARSICAAHGLDDAMAESVANQIEIAEMRDRVEVGYWRNWIDRRLFDDSVLSQFSPNDHAELSKTLEEVSHEWDSRHSLSRIRYERAKKLGEVMPDMSSRSQTETALRHQVKLINREAVKVSRHVPMRKILDGASDIVRAAKPCFLMSPLSVAQNLPLDFTFDILIFDEASQIRPWDAVGVLARSSQVILAGDNKQMPPTNFFDSHIETSDDEDSVGDLDSILDQAKASGMREQWLRMHYRSQSEELIAFSNANYYNHELLMVPTFHKVVSALSLIDPGGTYEMGAGRNVVEARAVVDWATKRLLENPTESVGIITLNTRQQAVIEDLLDTARIADRRLDAAWSSEEPPFVKNLETVQGDERDHIALSVTFAPDSEGKQANRFGPLNNQGGERRLNVAVTRAKYTMTVFSSLNPDKIAIRETTGRGVRHLQAYLRFACNPEDSSLMRTVNGDGESVGGYDSPFEKHVADSLMTRGWETVPQVGCVGYRVDLGVVDSSLPGRFLAGIECDGATYHSSSYARERDVLRQRRLEDRGWTILRVWSTDWWRDHESVLDALDAELKQLAESEKAEGRAA